MRSSSFSSSGPATAEFRPNDPDLRRGEKPGGEEGGAHRRPTLRSNVADYSLTLGHWLLGKQVQQFCLCHTDQIATAPQETVPAQEGVSAMGERDAAVTIRLRVDPQEPQAGSGDAHPHLVLGWMHPVIEREYYVPRRKGTECCLRFRGQAEAPSPQGRRSGPPGLAGRARSCPRRPSVRPGGGYLPPSPCRGSRECAR